MVVLALVAIAMSGLLLRALVTGEFAGALFLVGFAALFAWQIGGFLPAQPAAAAIASIDLPKSLLP